MLVLSSRNETTLKTIIKTEVLKKLIKAKARVSNSKCMISIEIEVDMRSFFHHRFGPFYLCLLLTTTKWF